MLEILNLALCFSLEHWFRHFQFSWNILENFALYALYSLNALTIHTQYATICSYIPPFPPISISENSAISLKPSTTDPKCYIFLESLGPDLQSPAFIYYLGHKGPPRDSQNPKTSYLKLSTTDTKCCIFLEFLGPDLHPPAFKSPSGPPTAPQMGGLLMG